MTHQHSIERARADALIYRQDAARLSCPILRARYHAQADRLDSYAAHLSAAHPEGATAAQSARLEAFAP